MEDATALNQKAASLDASPTSSSNETTSSSNSTSGGSWWGGIFDKVKQQSETIIKIYKEDLAEFGKTITTDTKEVIKKTTEDEDVQKITSQIGNMLGINSKTPENEANQPNNSNPNGRVIMDRHLARILALQTELSTYCTEPSEQADFSSWKEKFKVSNNTAEISQLLATNDKIREIHTKLVPVAVSYTDFWERYYYKLHKLNQEEQRRAALIRRATEITNQSNNSNPEKDEEDLSWDLDQDEDNDISTTKIKESKDEVSVKPSASIEEKEELHAYFKEIDSDKEPASTIEKPDKEIPIPVSISEDPVKIETPKEQEAPKPQEELKSPKSQPKSSKPSKENEEEWDSWE